MAVLRMAAITWGDVPARTAVLYHEGLDHYAVAMEDPEGNEFDIN